MNKIKEVIGICPKCKNGMSFKIVDERYSTICETCGTKYSNVSENTKEEIYEYINVLKGIKAEIKYAKCEFWREEVRALRMAIRFFEGEAIGINEIEMELEIIREIKFSWERCFTDEISKKEIEALEWTIKELEKNCIYIICYQAN